MSHSQEILTLFQNYSGQLGLYDPELLNKPYPHNELFTENRFIGTFYNRFPQQYDPVSKRSKPSLDLNTINFYKSHFPKTISIVKDVPVPSNN